MYLLSPLMQGKAGVGLESVINLNLPLPEGGGTGLVRFLLCA